MYMYMYVVLYITHKLTEVVIVYYKEVEGIYMAIQY